MKTKFIDKKFIYDGDQLKSLYAYMNYELMGDSIVSWIGPCDISNEKMVDGEDLLLKAEIRSNEMLHFIVEVFNEKLSLGVALQRILASLCIDNLKEFNIKNEMVQKLKRSGDDIFFEDQKLSISVATQSPSSTLVHFALNTTNEGTPVKTCSLADFNINPKNFSLKVMEDFSKEYESIISATQKVKWVK